MSNKPRVLPSSALPEDLGYEVGYALGRFRTEEDALDAHEAGDIEQWITNPAPQDNEPKNLQHDVGYSDGQRYTEKEARNAYDAGEIDLWLAYVASKTLEEWEEWYKEYGEGFEKRWESRGSGDAAQA